MEKCQSEEVFSVNELNKIYQLLPKAVATKTDCLLYFFSRSKRGGSTDHDIVYKLADRNYITEEPIPKES